MAAGNVLAQLMPFGYEPPTSNFATVDTRNGHPCLDFDTTTQESAVWSFMLPDSYAGGNITVKVLWAASSATTGTVGWDVALEKVEAGTLDIDADSFASAQTITAATVNGTSGVPLSTSVTITAGAATDSVAAGDLCRLRVRRDVSNDTAAGDAEILSVTLTEA